MIPVTGGASRRAKIAADSQSIVMHAAAVFRELIGRDRIALHVRRVAVTSRASLRDVERVNLRPGVAGGPQPMNAMAIDADSHLGVAFGE